MASPISERLARARRQAGRAAGWRIGAGAGWPRSCDALRDLQADRACPDCARG